MRAGLDYSEYICDEIVAVTRKIRIYTIFLTQRNVRMGIYRVGLYSLLLLVDITKFLYFKFLILF